MPYINVTLLPGYDAEVRARLADRLAITTRSTIAAARPGTIVSVVEAATYYRDGRTLAGGGKAHPVAADLVRRFLQAMQERDLPAAQALLAPGFEMHFPGGAPMQRLEDLVEWSRSRYQRVAKVIEGVDECWADGDHTVVWCRGTLEGMWPDGSPFHGVRFVDRFEVEAGRIRRQDVWNDLAEARARQ